MKIMITFYTIISYYIFLLLFSLALNIVKLIYNLCHENEENIQNVVVDNPLNPDLNNGNNINQGNDYHNNNNNWYNNVNKQNIILKQ